MKDTTASFIFACQLLGVTYETDRGDDRELEVRHTGGGTAEGYQVSFLAAGPF